MRRPFVKTLLISFILLNVLPFTVQASEEVTQSPSTTFRGGRMAWVNAENAYTSNNVYATASIGTEISDYFNYGFDNVLPDPVDITKVELGLEYYCLATEAVYIRVSKDGGFTWSGESGPWTLTSEDTLWLDVTSYGFGWTRDELLDANFRARIRFSTWGGGSGCYPENMYFATTENISSSVENIQDWQFYNPKQIQSLLTQNKTIYILTWSEKDGWFADERSETVRVDEHDEGDYVLYDIYSGKLDIDYVDEDGKNKTLKWESHIELTNNHNVSFWVNDEWVVDTAENLFKYWDSSETIYLNHLWYNYTSEPFPVTNIKVTKKYAGKVYNVWTRGELESKEIIKKGGKTLTAQEYDTLMDLKRVGVPIGKFPPFLAILTKGAWTAHLDWIPVKVTYSSEEEEEKIWDCSYIGTNCTLAGSVAELSADWTDLKASKDLDKFLFSWNNSGTIENNTWSDIWDGNWSRAIRTLNSTVGLTIAFRFFVNDSVGVEYPSTICFFKTEAPSGFNWFPVVLILWVVLFLAVVFILTKK